MGAEWVRGCFGPGEVYPDHTDCSHPVPCAMIREQWRALEHVFQSGKARAIGVSNCTVAHLEALKRTATIWPPAVNQVRVGASHLLFLDHRLASSPVAFFFASRLPEGLGFGIRTGGFLLF